MLDVDIVPWMTGARSMCSAQWLRSMDLRLQAARILLRWLAFDHELTSCTGSVEPAWNNYMLQGLGRLALLPGACLPSSGHVSRVASEMTPEARFAGPPGGPVNGARRCRSGLGATGVQAARLSFRFQTTQSWSTKKPLTPVMPGAFGLVAGGRFELPTFGL